MLIDLVMGIAASVIIFAAWYYFNKEFTDE